MADGQKKYNTIDASHVNQNNLATGQANKHAAPT